LTSKENPEKSLTWLPCSIENLEKHQDKISSIAYFYGREIYQKLMQKVPVGIIYVNGKGSLRSLIPIEGYEILAEQRKRELINFGKEEDSFPLINIKEVRARYKKEGTLLYNGMLNPIIPYAIRGVLLYYPEYYKGDWQKYYDEMSALKNGWRSAWSGDFHSIYYYIRFLTEYKKDKNKVSPPKNESELLAVIRSRGHYPLSRLHGLDVKNSKKSLEDVVAGFVRRTLTGIYDSDINEKDKALFGPLLLGLRMTPDRKRIILNFIGAQGGLTTTDKKAPTGFRFYRKGDIYFKDMRPAPARIIDRNKVEIIYDGESEELWLDVEGDAEQNLCNGDGLPAYSAIMKIPKAKENTKPAEKKN
jgi:hypothetical protein